MNIVVIDFYAAWCGPCKMQDPIIEELKKSFEDKVEFKKIDIDNTDVNFEKYQIRAVPTLVIEKDGAIFKKYVGVTPLRTLKDDIDKALSDKGENKNK